MDSATLSPVHGLPMSRRRGLYSAARLIRFDLFGRFTIGAQDKLFQSHLARYLRLDFVAIGPRLQPEPTLQIHHLTRAGFSAPATRKTPPGKRGLVGWRNSRGAAILRDSANDRLLTFDYGSFQGT
jgi:hypothetical protein